MAEADNSGSIARIEVVDCLAGVFPTPALAVIIVK